jgi:N-acetylglutamate synthase-like GNAT family acetyltransferase
MIRYATQADIDSLCALILRMSHEQALFPYCSDKANRAIARVVDLGRVLVAEHKGVIVGSIGFEICDGTWYAAQPFIADLWTYVAPEHRRSTIALGLLRAFKTDARERCLPVLTGVVGRSLSGSRLYGRDFTRCGELFLMRR